MGGRMGEQEAGKGEWGAGALDEGRIERGGSSGRLGSERSELWIWPSEARHQIRGIKRGRSPLF